ncbi:MAG: patatin-like phospholipase family protein [Pseudomonadota bacterium]
MSDDAGSPARRTAGNGALRAVADRSGERDCGHWPGGANVKRINVALQGGGAHGAFGWGVLDALLADSRIEIEAISGTSAGAMNAVVAAHGLESGGPTEARARLEAFWRRVSLEAVASPIRRSLLDMLFSNWNLDHNPMLALFDMATRVVSPYQFNPLNLNPLRDILEREVDFAAVASCSCLKLFISATNVLTGAGRVFTDGEITADAVMASACIPYLFQAVEIDGAPYWDGGYMGNPVLAPFLGCCSSPDVLLVQVNPFWRPTTPKTAREILDREHEIAFNTALVHELAHIDFVNRCLDQGQLAGFGLRRIYLHAVGGGAELARLAASSKLNAEWMFLTHLRDLGRAAAARWLAESFDSIGTASTMDLSHVRHRPLHVPAGQG